MKPKRRSRRPPQWRSQPRPYIGPCRDPLELWFLEFDANAGTWRYYFENRDMALAALKKLKAGRDPRR